MRWEKRIARRVALCACLSATAVGVSAAEGLLSGAAFLPPGARLGLSNVVTMYAACALGVLPALGISLFKSLFVLATRGATAFLMSAAGGLLSTLICGMLLRRGRAGASEAKLGYIGIGVAGALLHNGAQMAVALLLIGTAALYYLPVLACASLVTGAATGALLGGVCRYLDHRRDWMAK